MGCITEGWQGRVWAAVGLISPVPFTAADWRAPCRAWPPSYRHAGRPNSLVPFILPKGKAGVPPWPVEANVSDFQREEQAIAGLRESFVGRFYFLASIYSLVVPP